MEEETGWLIEGTENGKAVWFTAEKDCLFSDDSYRGVRFSRKQDAEKIIALSFGPLNTEFIATEHIWS